MIKSAAWWGGNDGSISFSYWNQDTSGENNGVGSGDSSGVTPLSKDEMMQSASYTNWNFTSVGSWRIIPGVSFPYLSWQFGRKAPTIISGMVGGGASEVDVDGLGIAAAIDGNLIGSTFTGANGFYYFAFDPRAEGAILVWLDDRLHDGDDPIPSGGSATLLSPLQAGDANAHAIGLDIAPAVLSVRAGDLGAWTDVLSGLLVRALGNLTTADDDVPYSVADGAGGELELELESGLGFRLDAEGDFLFDGAFELDGVMLLKVGGSFTLAEEGRLASGAHSDAIILVAGDVFVNENEDEDAVSATNGRWVIASHTPQGGKRGNLAHRFRHYGIALGDDLALPTGLPDGNGFLYAVTPQVTVGLKGIGEKVYDGTTDANLSENNFEVIGGVMPGDTVSLINLPGQGKYSDADVGEPGQMKLVTVDLSGVKVQVIDAADGDVQIIGYTLKNVAEGEVGAITKRALLITGVSVIDKVYDGSANALLNPTNASLLDGADDVLDEEAFKALLEADGVDLVVDDAWAMFVDGADVGSGKAVVASGFALTGGDRANNYELVQPINLVGNIDKAPLIVRAVDAERLFGHANPAFTVGYEGFVENEGPEVIDGDLVVVTEADITSFPGEYALTFTGGLSSNNYAITLVPGALTVLPSVASQLVPDGLSDAYQAAKVDYYCTITSQGGINTDSSDRGDGDEWLGVGVTID